MTNTMPTDIRDIKGLVPLPGWPWWVWGLLALTVVVLAGLIWRRARRPEETAEPPLLPFQLGPAERARRALRELWEQHPDVEEFYTRLSAIVRRYLEERFGLRAPERTTEEFLAEVCQKRGASFQLVSPGSRAASRRPRGPEPRDTARGGEPVEPLVAEGLAPPYFSEAHRQRLGDFLQEADLVKFARFRPGEAQRKRAYDAAERFVRETGQNRAGLQPVTGSGVQDSDRQDARLTL